MDELTRKHYEQIKRNFIFWNTKNKIDELIPNVSARLNEFVTNHFEGSITISVNFALKCAILGDDRLIKSLSGLLQKDWYDQNDVGVIYWGLRQYLKSKYRISQEKGDLSFEVIKKQYIELLEFNEAQPVFC